MIKILNELTYVEKLLEDKVSFVKEINNNTYLILNKLARYYYHVKKYKKTKILLLINQHMKNYYIGYNVNDWYKTIDKQVREAKKHSLIQIENILISKKEMRYINNYSCIKKKKILFTMLCSAKYHNLISDSNNNWCNINEFDLFKLANVSCSKKEKGEIINELVLEGAISLSKRHSNNNMCVNFIDDIFNEGIEVRVFRLHNLGFQYLSYMGEKYKACAECGEYFSYHHSNSSYCKNCVGYKINDIKIICCADCKKEFITGGNDKRTIRCNECQDVINKNNTANRVRKYRKVNCLDLRGSELE